MGLIASPTKLIISLENIAELLVSFEWTNNRSNNRKTNSKCQLFDQKLIVNFEWITDNLSNDQGDNSINDRGTNNKC